MSFSKSFSITCSVLFVLLLACPAKRGMTAVSEKSGPALGKNHALIIGISNYDSWPKLASPVKDAQAIAKVLTEKYNFRRQNTVLLTDNSKEKPTLANIINHLAKFPNAQILPCKLRFFIGLRLALRPNPRF